MTDRQSTHGYDCWGWRPKHYECAVREVKALRAEVERLRAKTACTMGVGRGDGSLFVHGDYESIKAAQALVLRSEQAEARAERLAEALRELVAVFSESGMYDEEVFARARAALDREDEQRHQEPPHAR